MFCLVGGIGVRLLRVVYDITVRFRRLVKREGMRCVVLVRTGEVTVFGCERRG